MLQKYIDGDELAEVFKLAGFKPYEVEAIRVGEHTNQLPRVFKSIASFSRRSVALRQKLNAALAYPAFVVVVAAIILYGLLRFLVPMFSDMFARSGLELPALTQVIVSLADWLALHSILIVVAGILTALTYTFTKHHPLLSKTLGWLALRTLPSVALIKEVELAKVCETTTLMLSSGLDLTLGLEAAAKTTTIPQLAEELIATSNRIKNGASGRDAFAGAKYFPRRYVGMIEMAEATNSLTMAFERLGSTHQAKSDQIAEKFKTFIEPILIVTLGFIIGIILVAMYLPLFSMTGLVR